MLKYLATLLAFFAVTTAQAQQFSSPPDVGTYQARQATYAAGNTPNVLGDGSNAAGGVAPAFTTHPEPVEDESGLDPAWLGGGANACPIGNAVDSCREKKFRTHSNANHFNNDDPIRFWGQPGVTHCHEYFGNKSVNAFTTRASLRARPASTSAGGTWQSNGYWEPCWQKTIAGKVYAMPATMNTIYYSANQDVGVPIENKLQRLHKLLRFIGGINVDDPDNLKVKAEIAAANAQAGTPAGRYSFLQRGFGGYHCLLANGTEAKTKTGAGQNDQASDGFTMLDGSDPWEVTPGVRGCPAGSKIVAKNGAPECWDGWNPSSPSGYDHFRYKIRDNVLSKDVCPNGWYEVPAFQVNSDHQTQGWEDYRTWSLSSDAHVAAKLGRAIPPGASAHFDWMNGQAKKLMDLWLPYCLGVGGAPNECNDSTVSADYRLVTGPAPDGSRPQQVNFSLTVDTNNPAQLHLVDKARATHVNMKGM